MKCKYQLNNLMFYLKMYFKYIQHTVKSKCISWTKLITMELIMKHIFYL